MSGRVSFIGAGPGAADLLTVRGARRIAEADVVVWAANVVSPECVQQHANAHAQLVDSSRLSHEEAIEIYRRAERDGLNVARVHSGDSALWSGIQDQYDACLRMSLTVEMVPGVPTFSAAAAAAGRELTIPEIADSLVLTKLEAGNSALPDNQRVREFAKHGTSMALFLSAARAPHLVAELRAGGYPDDVPVLIAYKVSCPDELILRTTLGDLEQAVKQHRLWRNTLFIVSRALDESSPRPYLYQSGQLQTYRRAQASGRNSGRVTRTRATTGRAPRSAVRQNAANIAREAGTDETAADTAESAGPAAADSGDAAGSKAVPQPRDAAKSWRSASRDERRQSDSDLAWWAVRDWQKAAREASRPGEKRVPAREESAPESEDTVSAAAAEVVASAEAPVTPEHQVFSVDSADSATEPASSSAVTQAEPEAEPQPDVEAPAQDHNAGAVDGQVESAAQAPASKTASKTSKASSGKSGSAKSGASRSSAAKSSARSGAAKSSSAKSSAAKSGTAKSNAAKTSAAKTSTQSTSAKTSSAKSGAAKSGTAKRATRSSARKSQQAQQPLPADDSGSA